MQTCSRMKELVFLLEEPSAQAMLEVVVRRLLGDAPVSLIWLVFDGKDDLDKSLKGELLAYRKPGCVFLVLRDQDHEPDCVKIKKMLRGKIPPSHQAGASHHQDCLHRIGEFLPWRLARRGKGAGD